MNYVLLIYLVNRSLPSSLVFCLSDIFIFSQACLSSLTDFIKHLKHLIILKNILQNKFIKIALECHFFTSTCSRLCFFAARNMMEKRKSIMFCRKKQNSNDVCSNQNRSIVIKKNEKTGCIKITNSPPIQDSWQENYEMSRDVV